MSNTRCRVGHSAIYQPRVCRNDGCVSINIRRWKKYGYDRAYASDESGASWGFIDLKTGEVKLKQGAPPSVALSLRLWATERTEQTTPTPEPQPHEVAHTLSNDAPYVDLALNTAGQNAATKAQEEWAAYAARRPVASKVALLFGLRTPDRSWAVGAAGEREVGRRLERLTRSGWHILHSVPIGNRGSDIDHLLIGPAGVFCINTKNHSNANVWVSEKVIMVNGQKQPYLRNSRTEGERVSRILTRATGWDIKAKPVIVVMARRYTERSRPADVWIVGRRQTPRAFERLEPIYSSEAVETIYRIARNSAIWS